MPQVGVHELKNEASEIIQHSAARSGPDAW